MNATIAIRELADNQSVDKPEIDFLTLLVSEDGVILSSAIFGSADKAEHFSAETQVCASTFCVIAVAILLFASSKPFPTAKAKLSPCHRNVQAKQSTTAESTNRILLRSIPSRLSRLIRISGSKSPLGVVPCSGDCPDKSISAIKKSPLHVQT
ncbi:hypothetical protein ESCOCK349M_22350 [Escherichia coli]